MTTLELALKLQGYEYITGWQDCYSVVQEFYDLKLGLVLPSYSRPNLWYMTSEFKFFDEHFNELGFKDIGDNPLNVNVGDAILFHIGDTETSNHIAVYVGRNKILHHMQGNRSLVEEYTPRWRYRVSKILRHPDFEIKHNKNNPTVLSKLPYRLRKQLKAGSNVEL